MIYLLLNCYPCKVLNNIKAEVVYIRFKITLVLIGCLLAFFVFFRPEIETKSTSNHPINWAEKIVGHDPTVYDDPVKIAILDSGINKDHPALEDLKFEEYNAISKAEEAVSDDYGHGTAIAGLVAGQGERIQGVLTNPIIYDVKVLDENGEGKLEPVVEGIKWSINNEVDIINISFGFTKDYEELHKIIQEALKQNIIVVASSGNNMGLFVDYPASYEGVISIGSINEQLQIDESSAINGVDYFAPGIDVVSTSIDKDYEHFSGTSFACAYATGIISSIVLKEDYGRSNKISSVLNQYVISTKSKDNSTARILTLNKKILEDSK